MDKNGSVILSSKKQSCHFNSYYLLSVGSLGYALDLGCLKGNFAGTEFNLFRMQPQGETRMATITYSLDCCSCQTSFRRVQVYINKAPSSDLVFQGLTSKKNLKELYEDGYSTHIDKLVTLEPSWNERKQTYTLNFGGKHAIPSIRNMILTP